MSDRSPVGGAPSYNNKRNKIARHGFVPIKGCADHSVMGLPGQGTFQKSDYASFGLRAIMGR
jgi:hypothetical protein